MWGCRRGFCCSAPQYGWGQGGGEEGHTHTHTHTHTQEHTQERTRECCTYPFATYPLKSARTKNQPKEEVFGTDVPRTSRGHSRGYPGPKLRSGRSKSWKNKHFGADIHDPKAQTSTTLRDFQKLRSEKLWAEAFSFPK